MIFILGIDALDYELVDKLNLDSLKQLEYSKTVVPIHKKFGIPLSPEVWASFLTGKYTPKHFEKPQNFKRFLFKLNRSLKIDFSKGILEKIKLQYYKYFTVSNRFGKLNKKTFLDITQSMEINVPFYSFDNKTFDIGHLFGKGELSLEKTVKGIKLIYESRKKQIFNELDNSGNEDVVFAFMHTADMLSHYAFLRRSEIELHYIDLNNYVSALKLKLADFFDEVIFIIVSDHGFDFDKGTHSMKGFYSSNTHLIPKPENITDFYGIILELVNKNKELYRS